MGAKSGVTLKLLQWFNRGIQFASAALILALTSYFLAALSSHSLPIPVNIRAVEGIAGIAVVYAALGVLLVCCLAGYTLTSFVAILLDVAFVGAFIYVATVYKAGAASCAGDRVQTVFGVGAADAQVAAGGDGGVTLPLYRTACKMESANLAVAVVAIVFFLLSAATEFALGRHRKKEQRFGPSPANNYTSGYGGGKLGALFRRRGTANRMDEDPNALPMHTDPSQLEANDGAVPAVYDKYGEAGYRQSLHSEYPPPAAPIVGATVNGFGNVPGHGRERYGDGTYNV